MVLSGSHPCVRRGYTLPQSIKEEKKDEERVGIFEIRKERRLGKLKVKKKQERKFREFSFIFCLRFVKREL